MRIFLNRAASPVEVYLYELTVSYERNVDDANIRKTNRYAGLEADIKSNGFKCSTVCFEIGQRGYINNRNKLALGSFLRLTRTKIQNLLPENLQDKCTVQLRDLLREGRTRVGFAAIPFTVTTFIQ